MNTIRYLFQRDKLNANLDTGDKSLQCGRRNDALKLWMAWAAMGTEGYQRHIDNIWGCARYLRDEVLRRDGFELVSEPMCTNVCFWCVSPLPCPLFCLFPSFVLTGRPKN